MKSMLKEFFSVKKTRPITATCIILGCINAILNARVTIWIASIFENVGTDRMMFYLNLVLIEFIIVIIMALITSKFTRSLGVIAYTELVKRVSNKILQTDYDTFTKNGEAYMQTIVESVDDVSQGGRLCIELVNQIISFIAVTASICIVESRLIVPIVIIYSIAGIIIYKFSKMIAVSDKKWNNMKHKRNDEVQKIISGFAEVRSNSTEKYHYEKIASLTDEGTKLVFRKHWMTSFLNMIFEAVDSVIAIIIIMYAIIAIPHGLLTSTAMTLVIYVWRLLNPLINLVFTIDENSVRLASFKKYKEFMDTDVKVNDGKISLKSFDSSIQFENVSFKYEKSDTVLNNISFVVKKGEKIGICGHSGGGKSTLLKLIPRFYDVIEGRILIDGIDIRDLTKSSLRKKIGIVHQANYIFKGTIMDNVTYGVGSVTEEQVVTACKQANIYDFIVSLPEGFNTDVGPNGLKLSGGQQQRISLACIFLNKPEIILLDEATSALDNESESVIQDSLKMFKDKTIITVAHRLSTIKDSDRIIVIDEHSIAEEGTHSELMEKDGMYKKLHAIKM